MKLLHKFIQRRLMKLRDEGLKQWSSLERGRYEKESVHDRKGSRYPRRTYEATRRHGL